MTDAPRQSDSKISTAGQVPKRHGLVPRAKFAIFWERLTPLLLLSGAPAFTILITSLFDGWRLIPQWGHFSALVTAAGASAYAVYRFKNRRLWPTRREALARLEADGRVRHDALQSLEDRPFGDDANPLWRAHLEESRSRAISARLRGGRETADAVDPYGLRYSALALFLIAVVSAGGDLPERLIGGLFPSDPRASAPGFADLWIEPPAYTGKAPIYLLGAADKLAGKREIIEIPAGSAVIAQINARSSFRFGYKSAAGFAAAEKDGPAKSSRARLVLEENGVIKLRAGGREGRWPVSVIQDRAPKATLAGAPQPDDAGRTLIAARVEDDYGVASAALRLRLVAGQERPLDAPAISDTRKSESRLLPLDGAAGPSGERRFVLDLQSDPWAGLETEAVLIVTDAAGQTGETDPATFTLPQRAFFNPLARAVIEQRQTLAIAPAEWRRVEWALSGLTLGPQHFFDRATDYLLLRTAMWRVTKKAGTDYSDTVEEFWPLALQLEDEALELARRRLEAAKEALRNALETGAGDNEIERLTEELRSALQQYLQALAQSGQQMAQDGPPPDETLTSADLDAMLDTIRDLAKSGAQNAAREALSDLENLLNNLRMSGQQGGGREGAQGRAAGEGGNAGRAGDLIGRQRELANKSFTRGQTRGAAGEDLADEQGGIAGDVSDLIKDLDDARAAGAEPDPDGKAAKSLGQALAEMRRSEEALDADEFEAANEAMERAIDALREGGQELARAAGEQERAARGEGEGASVIRDPLGRQIGEASGDGVDVPDKTDAQRARELLQELRRRLSNGERTQEEIDYLERLLERF